MRNLKSPKELAEFLNLYGPMVVADFGAGAGFFTIPMAGKISNKGTIYALDIQEEPLEALRKEARAKGLHNVRTMRADLEKPSGSNLKGESADIALISHVLFQSERKNDIIKEAFRILKKGGNMVIVEWYMGSQLGPRIEDRIPKKAVSDIAESIGFSFKEEFTVATHSYGLIFKKNE